MSVVKKTICIGLTGGIGSGKTTAANTFKKLNVPIIDADGIARHITQKNEMAYEKIVTHFGKKILNNNHDIDRAKLRELIFENKIEKEWLEDLLHPMIRKIMKDAIEKIKSPYCICIIPLLAESTGIDFIDRVLVIDTPVEMQLVRAKKRDDVTEIAIQKIIDSQSNQAARIKIAHDVLSNTGDIAALEEKIMQLHQQYLRLSSKC
ncbi:MAG TPA: dephospho-CoA kinase [Coxiellaceae bacterium]|nr:MAG: dephospho-CoA kinase [Gammaproteobacteria bacterium RIFCSPHIGHO2_12_FULL_36_30]HLB56153.1 dephospho-CoA kinase [Coxiellaceae bacterium]